MLHASGLLGRFKRGLSGAFICHILLIGVQFVMVPVFAKHWGAETYGVWVLLTTIPTYIALGDIGFGVAAGTFMTQRTALGDTDAALSTFQTTWAILGAGCLLILFLGLTLVLTAPASSFQISHSIAPEEVRSASVWLVIYGAISLVGSINHGSLRANGDFAYSPVITAATQVFEAVASIAALRLSGTIESVAVTLLVARVFSLFLTTTFVAWRVHWIKLGFRHARWAEAKQMAGPALAMLAVPVAQSVFLHGTTLVVGLGANAAAVATFATTRTLTRAVHQTSMIFGQPLIPEFTAAAIRREQDRKARLYLLVTGSAIFFAAAGMVALFVIGPWLFTFWTRGAIEASWSFIAAMSFVMLLSSSWVPISNLLVGLNEQRRFTPIYLIVTIVGLAIAYVTVPALGVMAGALSMFFVEATMFVVMLRVTRQVVASPEQLFAGAKQLLGRIRRTR